MAHDRKTPSDAGGRQPRAERIGQRLRRLLTRLRRQYPAVADDTILSEVEEAERRITRREQRARGTATPHQSAWNTLRRVAMSRIPKGLTDLVQNIRRPEPSPAPSASEPAALSDPEPTGREILWRQALGNLSHQERLVCIWRKAGFSSEEIAEHMQKPTAIADNLFERAKRKLREALDAEVCT